MPIENQPPTIPPGRTLPTTSAAIQDTYELAAVSVTSRIADFWSDQPRLWFVQTEAILAPQKLSDDTRFNLVIGKLGKDALQQVSDIVRVPPDTRKFDTLKERLILVYEESENRQFEKLLSQMELGEQKPSQLLRRMRDLAHGKIADETLSMLWVRHLPSSVRGVLAVTDTKNPENQALVADKIIETMKPIEVAEITPHLPVPGTSQNLQAQIAKLTSEFQKFQRSFRPAADNGRRFSRSRSRSRSQKQYSTRNRYPKDGLCYYHYNFREKAQKCTLPCTYKKQEN